MSHRPSPGVDFTTTRIQTQSVYPRVYGEALVELARERDDIVCLSADLTGSTEIDLFRDAFPARFFNLGIAEANAVGVAAGMARSGNAKDAYEQVFARFEHVIESSKAGVRKPDPRIYQMMCDHLGLGPERCVYLDDLGINCKPAAQLGMAAIKVTSGEQALADLGALLGLDLLG